MKRNISKPLEKELWNLFTWVGMFRTSKIRIEGVNHPNGMILINDLAGFMFNFELSDIKAIKKLNQLCRLWMNVGLEKKVDSNGQSIFDDNVKRFETE